MKFWLDAQLSPYLAEWMEKHFEVSCKAVRDLGLRDADDNEIYEKAYEEDAIVITKDSDFVHFAEQKDKSPRILWITVGNTSNERMTKVLEDTLELALESFESGEVLVEIKDETSIERRKIE